MGANGIIYCNPYNNFVMNYYIDTNWCCGNSTILYLIHWGRVTHLRIGKLITMGWDNGLTPGRHQAIVSTNAGMLLTEPLGTNFSEILSEIHAFHSRKCIRKCRLRNGGHFVSASMFPSLQQNHMTHSAVSKQLYSKYAVHPIRHVRGFIAFVCLKALRRLIWVVLFRYVCIYI